MSQVTIQRRIQQLKKAQADLPAVLSKVARGATLRAIEAAQAATPPKEGTGRGSYIGTNTITGELKAHWATDSVTTPAIVGNRVETYLNNNKDYASYVNDGHRMDRHFVPGLYVNPESGLLEYDPTAKVGLVVGTKTRYVKGEFMVDQAKEAYDRTVRTGLDREIRRLLK